MTDTQQTLDQIWADDALGRRVEAQLVIDYVESASARTTSREDIRSVTLAIDIGYGEGKSFFLRRLAKQFRLTHPVAFVDAWADDVVNEPLTALAATLKAALDPLKAEANVTDKLASVLEKTGAVAKAVAIGALKRAAAALITESGVETAIAAAGEAPEIIRDAATAAASVGEDVVQAVERSFDGIATDVLMRDRIAEFERTKNAISGLKESLVALVD